MMTTNISNDSYWNDISSDQFFDVDDLFSSPFTFIHNNEYSQNSMTIKEEYEETSSSSEIDPEHMQTSLANNLTQEYDFPKPICGVCGAPATGYNFDQITCESCKAFFRRNALRDLPNLKCRFTGSCVIDPQTRRQCTYCRLKKCFDIKMRKDWIRTEEEVQMRQLKKLAKEQQKLNESTNDQQFLINLPIVARKKKRLMIKPTIQELTTKSIYIHRFFGYNCNLSDDDRIILNNITNAYQLVADKINGVRLKQQIPPPFLIQFFNEEHVLHESLITFYKSIPEFNQLDVKDRVLLIKFNLLRIVHLHCILIYQFEENPFIGVYMSKWVNPDFHRRMSRTHGYFNRFKEHPLVVKLALIVFIFSTNLSPPCDSDLFDDDTNKTNIHTIQDFYTTILWRYLNSLYGEEEAIRSMELIMTQMLQYQILMEILEEYIKQETSHSPCNPLESSLLRLT